MAGVSYVDLPGFIDQVDRRGLCAASMVPILTLRSEPSPRKSSPSIRLNRPERSSEVGAASSDRSSLAMMLRLVVTNPSFPTFSDQKGDDREGSDAVDPPRAEKPLSDQAQQHHGGEIRTRDRLDGVGSERAATDAIGRPDLCSGEEIHRRYCQGSDDQAWHREFLTPLSPQS